MSSTRRDFIKTASVLAAGSVIPFNSISKSRMGISPGDKIRVGLIGANGQGFSDLTSFLKNPEVECVAMCDIDRNVLNNRTDALVKLGFPKPKLYVDYRKMLENKDIDVIKTELPTTGIVLYLLMPSKQGNMLILRNLSVILLLKSTSCSEP